MLEILSKSDTQLVRRTLRGHREAFSTLVERYQSLVFAVAYGIVGHAADAEDITQDAFLAAFRRLPDLREPGKFRAWLLTIARNRASDVLVKRRRESPFDDAEIAAPDTTDTLADAELRALLRDRVERLPAEHREILLLHYYAGLKVREIAEQLEISTEAAKKRLQRARDLLSQRMLAHLRDTVEEQGSSAARSRKIIGLIAGASVPWLGASAVAAGTGLLTTAGLLKLVAGAAVSAGVIAALVVANQFDEVAPLSEPAVVAQFPVDAEVEEPALSDDVSEAPSGAEDGDVTTEGVVLSGENGFGGTVLDPAGAPQPGIKVKANHAFELSKEALERTTDERGQFIFEQPREPGFYLLQAFGDQAFGVAEIDTNNSLDERSNLTITLLPATDLRGVVQNAEGQGIPDATVFPVQAPINGKPERISDRWQLLKETKTDANGAFTMPYAWHGDWILGVDSPSYAYLEDASAHTNIALNTIVLKPGATVHGRIVIRDTDTGVPNLEFRLGERRRGATDADGNFSIAGIAGGAHEARLRGRHNYLVTSGYISVLPGRENAGVTIEVDEGGIISGRAINAETGEPIEHASIGLMGTEGGMSYGDDTDADGRYMVDELPPGEYKVMWLHSHNNAPLEESALAQSFKVDYGTVLKDVDFQFAPGASVAGTVDVPETMDLEKISVNVKYTLPDGNTSTSRSGIEEDGAFSIGALRKTSQVEVQLSGEGWTSERLGPFDLAQGNVTGLQLRPKRVAAQAWPIRGSVVMGRTIPKAGFTISLKAIAGNEYQTTQTDDEGNFAFSAVPPGDYRIGPWANDDLFVVASVVAGRETTGVLLDIALGDQEISGRVVDWKNNPLAGAVVSLSGNYPFILPSVKADEAGRFAIAGLDGGPFTVTAAMADFGSEFATEVTATARNINFVLKPAGHVQGAVVDATTGKPIPGAQLQILRNPEQKSITHALESDDGNHLADGEGHFTLLNLAADRHVVVARAHGYFAGYAEAVVEPEEVTADMVLKLEPSGIMTARVTDTGGDPVEGAKIFINEFPHTYDNDAFNTEVARTNAEGVAPLEHLQPGQNKLYVYHPNYGRAAFPLDTAQNQKEISLLLPMPGRLEGTVLNNGEPLTNRPQLTLEYPAYRKETWFFRQTQQADANGAFLVENVMPGRVRLQVSGGSGFTIERELEILPGTTTTLHLDPVSGTGAIRIETRFPATMNPAEFFGAALIKTPEGRVTLERRIEEDGFLRFQQLPAGEASVLIAKFNEGVRAGKRLECTVREGATVELLADFTAGVTISGSVANANAYQGGFVALVAGALDPNLVSEEDFAREVYPRISHMLSLEDGNTFSFDSVEAGTYTLLAAGSNNVNTMQVIEVGDADLSIALGLP